MKFYEHGELVATLAGDDAVERCLGCSYCYHNGDGSHTCIMGVEDWNLEEELENEDDNQLECWIP
jgi:hypothetical protein